MALRQGGIRPYAVGSERYETCDDEPKKKDFGKERKNAWVGSNLTLAKGRDAMYYAYCLYLRYALRGVVFEAGAFTQ